MGRRAGTQVEWCRKGNHRNIRAPFAEHLLYDRPWAQHLHLPPHLIPSQACEAGRINGSITEMMKWRLEEVQ